MFVEPFLGVNVNWAIKVNGGNSGAVANFATINLCKMNRNNFYLSKRMNDQIKIMQWKSMVYENNLKFMSSCRTFS